MPRPQDFEELRIQAAAAAESGGTVFEADPAVILALFERFDAETTTAEEGVEIVADLRAEVAILSEALRAACHDSFADGDGAVNGYLLRAAIAAGEDRPADEAGEAEQATGPADASDAADEEGELKHGWRLRQDEPLPDGALEVIENLASVASDCGASTAHAAALTEDDEAISTYGVLLDDGLTVGVAVDCETGVIRWVSRPAGQS